MPTKSQRGVSASGAPAWTESTGGMEHTNDPILHGRCQAASPRKGSADQKHVSSLSSPPKSAQRVSPAKVRTSPRLPSPCAGVQVQNPPSPEGNPSIVKDTHDSDASKKTKEVKGCMQWNARSTAALTRPRI